MPYETTVGRIILTQNQHPVTDGNRAIGDPFRPTDDHEGHGSPPRGLALEHLYGLHVESPVSTMGRSDSLAGTHSLPSGLFHTPGSTAVTVPYTITSAFWAAFRGFRAPLAKSSKPGLA